MIKQKLYLLSLFGALTLLLPSGGSSIVQGGLVNPVVSVPTNTTLTWNQFHNVSSSCSDWTSLTSNNFTTSLTNGVFSIDGTKQQGIYWAETAGFETSEQFDTSSPITLEMTGSVIGTGTGWGLEIRLADSQHSIDLGAYDDRAAGRSFAYVLPHTGRYRYPTDFQSCGTYTEIADIDVAQPHSYKLIYSERVEGSSIIASITASVDSNASVTMDLPWRLNNPNVIMLGTARDIGDTIHATVTNLTTSPPSQSPPSGSCFTDEFSTPPLASPWTPIDPLGDSSFSLTATPGVLRIATPDGNHDLNSTSNFNAPRMVQAISGDFDVSTKVTVNPTQGYQSAGLLFWLDSANFLWTGRGTDNQVAGVYTRDGQMLNPPQVQGVTNTTIYLRIARSTNSVTTYYSLDGSAWTQTGNIVYPGAAPTALVGMYLINQWQDNPISADFDYFYCPSSPPTANLKLAIAKLDDLPNGTIYPPNTSAASTVDGNTVTAIVKIEDIGAQSVQGKISIIDSLRDIILTSQSLMLNSSSSITVSAVFSSIGMAWDAHGDSTPQRSIYARFQPDTGSPIDSAQVSFRVNPRPVVLVHGLNDTAASWNTYLTNKSFLSSIGIKGYAIGTLDTGAEGRVVSIDKNAGRLSQYIKALKEAVHAEQVDVVAHSLGGLITRRYIAKKASTPDIHQLIMLGTPNEGSRSAESGALGEIISKAALNAMSELTPSSVRQFNHDNPVPQNILFYAIAGNYYCKAKLPSSNPIEPDPDDVAVSRDSVFAIAEHGRWTYPDAQNAGCGGDHRGMRSSEPNDGGTAIFALYVSPLLRGVLPTTQPELQSNNTEQGIENTLDAVQFSDVQTGQLQPGGRLEFSSIPEQASSTSFIVVGSPDQFTVSLRDPNGQVITPNTSDPSVQYMQMDGNLFPLTSYTISLPIAGAWTTIIEANTYTPPEGISVTVFGSLVSDLRLTLPASANTPQIHHEVTVMAQLRTSNAPILGAHVDGLLIRPDNSTITITLLDDGQHGDGVASDGVYGFQFTPTTPGVYSAAIRASGTIGSGAFKRSSVWATQVDGVQIFLSLTQR